MPFLDQVEQRHAGARVVAGDRHYEPEVALDQATLRLLVALVLAPGELALLGVREQATVADLPDVELERVLRRREGGFWRDLVVDGVEERLCQVPFHRCTYRRYGSVT